jgi:H+/Cl- antiporter ClcA
MAYVFIALVDLATESLWPETTEYGLFSGEPWWILLMGGAGLLIGLLRRLLGVQPVIPGLFEEVDKRRSEPRFVPRRVLVSFVSLVGGASVGPEAALGSMGGGLGTFISERRQMSAVKTETNTLIGVAGAFGGLFAAPIISALLVVEAATEGGRARYIATAVPTTVASTAGFAVYFAFAGTSFISVYQVPPFDLELWHFLLAVPLGVVAAGIAGLLGGTIGVVHRATARFRSRPELLGVFGGLALGLLAVAFPLTRFSGAGELATLLNEAPHLAAGLLIAILLAKILAVALSFGTGFYGGPIFPMIFIGGASGVAIHALFPWDSGRSRGCCHVRSCSGGGGVHPLHAHVPGGTDRDTRFPNRCRPRSTRGSDQLCDLLRVPRSKTAYRDSARSTDLNPLMQTTTDRIMGVPRL